MTADGTAHPASTSRQCGTILLLTGNSLCHNPRAMKAATTLAKAGYRVRVLGAWLDAELRARDQALLSGLSFDFTPVLDIGRPSARAAALHLGRRTRRKAAQLAHDLVGWQKPGQLGMAFAPLLRAAQRQPADLYIAHSEVGLCVAGALLRQGRRVAVDMEDWFSEDLLPEARRHRPLRLLRSVEGEVLRTGAGSFCPSDAMASALVASYGCGKPTVIRNAFPWADRERLDGTAHERRDGGDPSIYWFSQTLGPGRGIEDLLAALPLMQRACEVHLRGNPAKGFTDRMTAQLPEPWRDRVFLHGLVDNTALLSRIAEHDIGFAGEQTYCRSRDLTVTNKILHYLLGGLAVVASDTAGHKEVARLAPGAACLYEPGNPRELARKLDELITAPATLAASREAALRAAQNVFCWERQEPTLLAAVAQALATAPAALSDSAALRDRCQAS